MPMEICVLGSGSAGNAAIVRAARGVMMIDAGLGPRTVARRLAGSGVGLSNIRALLLTHLDRDHFKPTWMPYLRRHGIHLFCSRQHLHALYRHEPASDGTDARALHRAGLLHPFEDQPWRIHWDGDTAGDGHGRSGSGVLIRPVPLAHDRSGTFGFRVVADAARLGYATDLGRVPDSLVEAMADVDLLAIESNYDPRMQRESSRPWSLKRRIMGGAGHLSNGEAAEAVQRIAEQSARPPRHVLLLHLSRQCNTPELARAAHAGTAHIPARLCITDQYRTTPWLSTAASRQPLAGEQLRMFV